MSGDRAQSDADIERMTPRKRILTGAYASLAFWVVLGVFLFVVYTLWWLAGGTASPPWGWFL